MFYVIKKSRLILFFLLVFFIVTAFIFSAWSKDKNLPLCRELLKSLGYSYEKNPYETSDIKIPEGFGKVYENYNALQKEAGYDLTPLRGVTVKKYSFRLKNSEYTIANILIYNGKICGGDILSPSLSGKMIPLMKK